jgi:uncharacterized protein
MAATFLMFTSEIPFSLDTFPPEGYIIPTLRGLFGNMVFRRLQRPVEERRDGDVAQAAFKRTEAGLEVRIRLQPNASKSEITGLHGDSLKVRVQAKPVEGAANAALVKLIAKTAGVPKSAVELIRGATSRNKVLKVVSPTPEDVEKRLCEGGDT